MFDVGNTQRSTLKNTADIFMCVCVDLNPYMQRWMTCVKCRSDITDLFHMSLAISEHPPDKVKLLGRCCSCNAFDV